MKPRILLQDRRGRSGFTLVEILVSIVVLSLMLLAIALITSFATKTWLSAANTVDNFTKARSMLNLLDRDIQMMVLRRDLAAFTDSSGNPTCAFYANVQGYPGSDTRTLSLVQYKLSQSTTASALLRLSYGMGFTSGTVPTTGNSSSLPQLTSASIQSETLAAGVVAFQWQYVDGTGTVQTPSSTTPFVYNLNTPSAPTNARAILISMAVLGNASYVAAGQTNSLQTLTDGSSIFSTAAPSSSQTFSKVWHNVLESPTDPLHSNLMALPLRVREGIQVFDRCIPLPFVTPSA